MKGSLHCCERRNTCEPVWPARCVALVGCSAGKQRLATEQLVVSDSVDRSVAKIDFSPLRGQRVYLETKYMLASRPPVSSAPST